MGNALFKIGIYADFVPNSGYGGVESVLIGLIKSLGQLGDGDEEYIILANRDHQDWLKPYMGSNQRIAVRPTPAKASPDRHKILRKLGSPALAFTRRIIRSANPPQTPSPWPEIPVSDGFYENLGIDVLHFPFQYFILCSIPSIYNPHDLQHLHFPKFFTPATIAWREVIYPAGCRFAHTVAVGSNWIKHDVIDKYHISPEKIQIIPWAPPTQSYQKPTPAHMNAVKNKYLLPSSFALYPAVTWEHKNHVRLLEAMAQLRACKGTSISLVCTGTKNPQYWPKVKSRIKELKLEEQVHFLGQVPPEDLRALYKLAQFVVVPTLFEAASGPVFEAWQEGTPVTCSNITSLPEQAGNAALLFDPMSIDEIADAVFRMASDSSLREELKRNGSRRLEDFSWERTAKAYRAIYRRAARYPLTEEDKLLLSWDWMRDPKHKE
jgi:glycosyltransferase involved in cell wall biosynthesis